MQKIFKSLPLALGLSCMAIAPAGSETIAQSQNYGVAPPACHEQTQIALNFCAVRWAKTADFLRSLIYEDIKTRLTSAKQIQLKAIETNWNSYREKHCLDLSEPFRTGSIYPLLYHSCRARVTNDRIADLLGKSNSQLSPDETSQRLAKVLNQDNLKNSAGQVQWLRYQSLQCRFEALQFTETPQRAKQCRDRLAASRLRELESLMKIR